MKIFKGRKTVDVSLFHHLYPFQSHYLDLDGLKYHYIDEGTGEPVLMIHGNPTWSFYYRELIKALSPNFRTIVPDHIGCGLSDKPDIEQYDYRLKSRIENLGVLINSIAVKEKITLVVHDWGGIIGMAYALQNQEKIHRIIVMNTAAFLPPGEKRLPFTLWVVRNIRTFASPAVLGFNLFAHAALYLATYKGLTKDVKRGLTAPYNCWKNRIATLKFVQDIPVTEKDASYGLVKYVDRNLNRLKDIPMLICWGEHDFVFDTAYLNEWRRRFPKAEAHLFKDAGHYVLEDVPEKVIPLIKDFLHNYPSK
jgi:haloalkane dehalogenase